MRLLITGGVGSGKTTLAGCVNGQEEYAHLPVLHTDDLIDEMVWSEASQYVCDNWLTRPGPWIIEGVAIPRALRKYLEAHPHEPPPCDRIIVLTDQHKDLNPRQEAMSKTVYEHMADLVMLDSYIGSITEWR